MAFGQPPRYMELTIARIGIVVVPTGVSGCGWGGRALDPGVRSATLGFRLLIDAGQ